MGAIEDEFNRNKEGATRAPQKAALLHGPAAGGEAAPQKAALLHSPSPGERLRNAASTGQNLAQRIAQTPPAPTAPNVGDTLRNAAPTGPTLAQTVQARAPQGPQLPPEQHPLRTGRPADPSLANRLASNKPVGPPAPPESHPLRAAAPADPALANRLAANTPAGPPAPPEAHPLRNQANAGNALAARAPQGPPAPPEAHPLRARAPAGTNLAETIQNRAGATVPNPPTLAEKLHAAQLRADRLPGEPNLAQIIKARAGATQAPTGAPAAAAGAGGGAGVPPAATPPGTAGKPGSGAAGRLGSAIGEAARAAMPMGTGKVGAAGTALGKATAKVAGKALPFVAPVVEGLRVARVANDPQATAGDVAQQAIEGTGRWGATVGGAALLGGAGSVVGGPVGGAIGGVAGGIAGYVGGDAAISKLRSVFGLGDKSPVEITDARNDAARKAKAQALPAISEPVVQPPKTIAAAAAPAATAAQAPAAAPARGVADTPMTAPQRAAPSVSPIAQQLAALQQQQDASPIAHTTIGGAGSQVFYKDGSMSPLLPGQPIPEDVAQFNALHQRMNALRNGTPMPEDMPAPALPQGATVQAAAPRAGGKLGQVAAFADKYGGVAQRAGAALGVDPNLLLAQWGQETGWGKSVIPGTNNLGNIKAVRGQGGVAATDNMTGSRDNYLNFENADAFADHYAGLIGRRYQGAVGAGADMARFASALKAGGYAEDPKYAAKLGAAYQTLLRAQGGATGPSIAAAAGIAPQVATGINNPVHVIKGMDQTMAVPTAAGYTEVPKSVFDAARRSPTGFAENGTLNNYLDGTAQNAAFRANPVSAEMAKLAMQGQNQQQAQVVSGEYGLAQQGMQNAATLAAAQAKTEVYEPKITMIPGGESIDPKTGMPTKQPATGVYMKDGVPTFIEPPKAKVSEQEAHAQARAAIAGKADRDAVNARLVENGFKPLPN